MDFLLSDIPFDSPRYVARAIAAAEESKGMRHRPAETGCSGRSLLAQIQLSDMSKA